MAKGNFLGKVGKLFVESNGGDEIDYKSLNSFQGLPLDIPELDVEVNMNVTKTVSVEEIYKDNELGDLSNSIFKVEEIKVVLPENLPTVSKKSAVIGMMGVSHLKLEDVLADAEKRTSILTAALKKFSDETCNNVIENEEKIVDLESQINELKEKNIERKKYQEDQEIVIEIENKKIQSIVDFIK